MTPVDQHVLVPKGPQAAHIAELWWLYLAVASVVVLLVWAFVLIALFRKRVTEQVPAVDEDTIASTHAPAGPLRTLPAGEEKTRQRWVFGATGITIVTLVVLLVESVAAGARINGLPRDGQLEIELTGHRWWWGARYLDDDKSQIFATANELHVPVGRTVELSLRSADVIHSFWVPNLAGKRDLIPGRTTRIAFRADHPGRYRGQCAEFCGHAHAEMALWIVAESEADFQAWSQQQRADAPTPSTPIARRGHDVFMSGPCVMCHGISGTIAQSSQGPDLTHFASRKTLAAGTLENTRGHLAGWVLNAPNIKPGTEMPSITLPADDLHALIAYLETLR